MHREWKEERRNAQCIIEKSPNILATLQWQSSGLPDPALSIGLIVCVVKTWYHQSEYCCVLLNRVLTQFLAVSAFQHSHCSHCNAVTASSRQGMFQNGALCEWKDRAGEKHISKTLLQCSNICSLSLCEMVVTMEWGWKLNLALLAPTSFFP